MFWTLVGFSLVFCVGQWSAWEGYTLGRGWAWVKDQIPASRWQQWERFTTRGTLGSFWDRIDAGAVQKPPRAIPGERAIGPARPVQPAPSVPAPSASILPKKRLSLDEEGLSPADREALIGLLK